MLQNQNIIGILVLIFIFASFNICSASDNLKEAEKYFQQALATRQQGEIEKAIGYLKEAIRLNKNMAKAHHQLALLYMDEGTVQGRFWATFEIEKALRIEPDNLQLLYAQALLNLRKGINFTAERQFKKLVQIDPTFAESYKHLAAMKEAEMLHYQDMISIDPNSDGIIYMQPFANMLLDEAADYYKKSIAAEPQSAESYYSLALLYFDSEDYQQMEQLLESAVKINSEDKNCHLFLGLAYQQNEKYELALQQYILAKGLMDKPEQELMESIDLILTPEKKAHFGLLSSSEKISYQNIFWKQKDPFYLSEQNERQLAHFSRVAYANLRFSQPGKNLAGWQSDMGMVYIRYGKPKSKFKTKPYLGEMASTGRNPLVHSREVWIYPDFSFTFEDEYLSGNYSFARHVEPEYDNKLIYNEKIKNEPDYFQLFPDSIFFRIPLDIVSFRGEEGFTELEFCYAISARQLKQLQQQTEEQVINKGLFVFNQQWETQIKQISQLLLTNKNIVVIGDHEYFVAKEKAILNPGNFHYALEFENKTTGNKSAVHEDVQVDSFAVNDLQISDILFASQIKSLDSKKISSRQDFGILPNPHKIFKMGKPVTIYFEIYNLSKNLDGGTRYQIDYRIGTDFRQSTNWKKLLSAIGLKKKEGEVTTSFEYSGTSSKECLYQNLSLQATSGAKKLLVKITDLTSGLSIEKISLFTIIE